MPPIEHPGEIASNTSRERIARLEPISSRTFTPTQAVLARSAGVFHWTPEGRQLYDFTSGVLVANLGHNPQDWLTRFRKHLGWDAVGDQDGYCPAPPLTAYNAITPIEVAASDALLQLLCSCPGDETFEQVLWAASGSEAIQKALWAALSRDTSRSKILATRHGFHGKKGLAGAVTGSERDPERDARVHFISFPMETPGDVPPRERSFDPLPYRRELDQLWAEHGKSLGTLITEPYLGGGGSHHPPREYLHLLQQFCEEHDLLFILDEVQSNFGRTGHFFAFEAYGLTPDIVVLGKGLGNGVPVAAAVGRGEFFAGIGYGGCSDTYSGNPLSCAAVLATIETFRARQILERLPAVSTILDQGLKRLREFPWVRQIRGEPGGMVWGVEFAALGDRTAEQMASAAVLEAYRGNGSFAIHLLGPLTGNVVRIAPPLVITDQQARHACELLYDSVRRLR